MTNFNVTRRYTLRLCFVVAVIIYALWRHYRVNHDIRYTVATTTRRTFTPRNNYEIEYNFTVRDKVYTSFGADLKKYNIHYPHGRYYVKFPYKSSGASEIMWDRPVPDSILAPADGWKDLP